MNKLVKDLKNTFISSLCKTADVLNVSDVDANKALCPLFYDIDFAFDKLDKICTEFGKALLNQPSVEEKDPDDLEIVFYGQNGGKIYSSNLINELIINDKDLVEKDLRSLELSMYTGDWKQHIALTQLINEKGFITLKEYKNKK